MTEDSRIKIDTGRVRVRVITAGRTLADTQKALILRETDYAPVYYLPPDDVRRELLRRSDRRTHCPYKGDATYWTLAGADGEVENVAWSYEDPLDQVKEIKSHFAFYPDKVDIEITQPS